MKAKLPPMVPRSAKNAHGRQKDYTPTEWKEFFNDSIDVVLDTETSFRCYRSKPAETEGAPVLVLLHGGGYNALTWSVFTVSRISTDFKSTILSFCFVPDGDHFSDSLPMLSNRF